MKRKFFFYTFLIPYITLLFIKNDVSAQAPNWLWAKNPSGNLTDVGMSIAADANGNVYVTGHFWSSSITFGSTTLINTSFDSLDIFVAKYDAVGNVLWAKNFGGTNDDYPFCIAADAIGNCYITGTFHSTSITFGSTTLSNQEAPLRDFFIAKIDSSGNSLWAKSAGDSLTTSAVGEGISLDSSGNIYVDGDFQGTSITFGSTTLTNADFNTSDIFIVKYDASGNILWAKRAGGADYDFGHDISSDVAGNFYLAGEFWSASIAFGSTTLTNANWGTPDIFTAKYDSSGNAIWAKRAGDTYDDLANGISIDTNGNCFITGTFDGPVLSFDTITVTNSGGNADIFVAKYDPSGHALWAKGIAGNMVDNGNSIVSDLNGNCYVTGAFTSDSLIFGNTTTLTNTGVSGDIFVAKYDPLGNVVWATSAGGSNGDVGRDICIDAVGDAYITGSFQSASIPFGSIVLTNTSIYSDIFIAKLSSSVGFEEYEVPNDFRVYPNPVTNNLTIEISSHSFEKNYLSIYNPVGEKIYKQKIVSEKTKIDLTDLQNGIYFVQVNSDSKILSRKILLQK
jgi:hypothetical protein